MDLLLPPLPAPTSSVDLGLPILERHAGQFGEVFLEWERIDPFQFSFRDPQAHRLTVVLNDGADLVQTSRGMAPSRAARRAGDLLVTPAGQAVAYSSNAPLEVLALALTPAMVNEVAEEIGGPKDGLAELAELARPPVRDAALLGLARALRGELASADGMGSRLFVDSAVRMILVRLLRGAPSHPSPRPPAPPAGLPVWRLRRVQEFIEASLERDLSLAELAQAAGGMSPWHFLRLFRASTGLPPVRYVATRRVEHARRLLRERPTVDLAEVAFACGFRDQSAFCRAFLRATGRSPGAYRDGR